MSTGVVDRFAERLRYEATDYLNTPAWPDSREAASLTKAGRAWQRLNLLVSNVEDYLSLLLAAVTDYQVTGEDVDVPVPATFAPVSVNSAAAGGLASLEDRLVDQTGPAET